MMVNWELVTLDGSECDKIGVSYTGYTNQGNACSNEPYTCLHNQIKDLYNSDQALIA